MRRRTRYSLWIALALLLGIGVALFLRSQAPPEAARLLPESDAIIFVNLKPIRAATHFDRSPALRVPELQQFIAATGIVPERDLDSAAFALHRVPDTAPTAKEQQGVAADLFVSEVFTGRFDAQRLQKYLQSIATDRETYAGREVYSIHLDTGDSSNQTLRIAQLGYDTIAASNMPTSEQIHAMLDRSRASALGTSGSSLLAARFREVPLLAPVWAIGHLGLPFSENGTLSVAGFQLPIPADADLVASLGYTALHLTSGGSIHLRIVQFAPDALAARHTVDGLTSMLAMLRGLASARPPHTPADTAMRAVVDSLTVVQKDDRAQLDANASIEQMKALTSAPATPAEETPDAAKTPHAAKTPDASDATPKPGPASK